ncbi:hypothetical protein [Polynucleobacter sphagniphilus]|uniref:MASE1 domain-containing protein n=1 Tax=Polynucleobacter sphagniphilus TaxID=1743169 RepID=A0AA43MB34_9BURK|nr:hypothetical protein [Polynucleobacter sphagniphilus]MDH6504527.1 hypothetical protein [Polynucleobacter sphagniphilus]MDH6513151.1 hypothetical protein [Polynucleobacter sphagniphilus]
MTKYTTEGLIGIAISANTYALLFYLNDWLTQYVAYGLGVSWIYLPAGLRLFLTLIFGFPGALGIALATFLISYLGVFSQDLVTCIGIAIISGFAPYLARVFVLMNIKIAPDLSDLNFPKLLFCMVIYALFSSGLHQWWFATRGLANTGGINYFIAMFTGDVMGTVLMVTSIKYGLDYLKDFRKIRP